jgi:hypothetical protein
MRELAQLCGGRVSSERQMDSGEYVQTVRFSSHRDKVRFFAAMAHEAASAQEIQALARSIVSMSDDRSELGRIVAVHCWAQGAIEHIGEPVETVPEALQVAMDGCGDCDDSAVLVMALLTALGHPACLLPLGDPPRHVCAGVRYQGTWYPLETTIDALAGEHPVQAARRLGLLRKDIQQQ